MGSYLVSCLKARMFKSSASLFLASDENLVLHHDSMNESFTEDNVSPTIRTLSIQPACILCPSTTGKPACRHVFGGIHTYIWPQHPCHCSEHHWRSLSLGTSSTSTQDFTGVCPQPYDFPVEQNSRSQHLDRPMAQMPSM